MPFLVNVGEISSVKCLTVPVLLQKYFASFIELAIQYAINDKLECEVDVERRHRKKDYR